VEVEVEVAVEITRFVLSSPLTPRPKALRPSDPTVARPPIPAAPVIFPARPGKWTLSLAPLLYLWLTVTVTPDSFFMLNLNSSPSHFNTVLIDTVSYRTVSGSPWESSVALSVLFICTLGPRRVLFLHACGRFLPLVLYKSIVRCLAFHSIG
jgi:hypothetical protein